MAPAESIPAITRLVKNRDANLPGIRAIAAKCMGEILLRTKMKTMPEETFETLVDCLNDDSPLVRAAAGAAIGMSPVKAEERYKAFKSGRINR